MSPHKSFISQNRLISPDLAQTKQNNKKYSLKNLLSPPKPPINGTDKKKAWKWGFPINKAKWYIFIH